MENIVIKESEVFGREGGWRLMYRAVDDGVRRVTRVLPVAGMGVLMQTLVQQSMPDGNFSEPVISGVTQLSGLVLVEYAQPEVGGDIIILHRELMTPAEFSARHSRSRPGQKAADIRAGSVVTFNVSQVQSQDTSQVVDSEGAGT
jgi:hypothetical protein